MQDLSHEFGADLAAGPTGDLALADGVALGRQRVLRRLLTNPGDYIWQPEYGAGLGRFVGEPASPQRIRAVVLSQVFREAAVARSPEPVVIDFGLIQMEDANWTNDEGLVGKFVCVPIDRLSLTRHEDDRWPEELR